MQFRKDSVCIELNFILNRMQYNTRKFHKNKSFKIVLLSIGICIFFFLILIYGYSLGFKHEHITFVSRILPNSFTKLNVEEAEIIERSFSIRSNFNEKNMEIVNSISFPHSWYFDEEEISANNDILDPKKYVISSSNGKVKLTIIPKGINNLRSVLSVTTVFTQEIKKKCLGSYSISGQEEFESIDLYRDVIDSNNIIYTQKVSSAVNLSEEPLDLKEFFVFKRNGGFVEGDELVWTADITLKFDESVSSEEKEAYLVVIDEIISSLRIK